MSPEQQEQMAVMLENAAKILRSERDAAIKINTLTRIGDTATFLASKWGDEEFKKVLDALPE